MCRVRGPAAKDNIRYRSHHFPVAKDFYTDVKTRGILVSDFHGLGKAKLEEFLRMWQKEKSGFLIADIDTRVCDIPSFKDVLEGNP